MPVLRAGAAAGQGGCGHESDTERSHVADEGLGLYVAAHGDPWGKALTTAVGLKRLALAAAALLALGAGGLLVVSSVVPADRIRDALTKELGAAMGVEPKVRGSVSVSLFPTSAVTFGNVAFGAEGQEPLLVTDRLTARLRLFPLLLGRVETADITLLEPRITVAVAADGRSNWAELAERLSTNLTSASWPAISFSEIRVSQGTVVVRDEARKINETLTGVEMSLAWPAISKSFGATGQFVWRLEQIDASVSVSDLLAALVGKRSGLKLRLSGAPFKLAFDGHFSHRPTLKIEGTLAADAPSLRDAIRWSGREAPPGGGFGRFAVKAQAKAVGSTVSLPQVNMELDGNAVEGVLSFARDHRVTMQGTLAADTLDLTPYVSTVQLLRGREREWSRQPLNLDGLSSIDVDLRISSAQTRIANAKLGRSAVVANLRDSKLAVSIGETQAFGGLVKGGFMFGTAQGRAEVKSELQFANVDLEACLGELFGIRRIEGKGNLALALDASGENVLAMARTLTGTATLSADKGSLTGFNVEQLLRRLERRPLSGGGDFRTGRTPFDKLRVGLKIAQGMAAIEDVRIEGESVRLAMAGSASVPARDLDLKGTASLLSASNGSAAFELPFVVQGPWDDPLMLPDPQSLIRRSGAAAPLLEAVRDRRTRDAVRSAIEQLTRPAGPGEPAAGAAPTRIIPAPSR